MLEALLIGILGLASVVCLVLVWRSQASLARKLFWTLAALVPLLGPLFCAALFDGAPGRQDRDMDVPDAALAHGDGGADAGGGHHP
jgi:hypothetical protein